MIDIATKGWALVKKVWRVALCLFALGLIFMPRSPVPEGEPHLSIMQTLRESILNDIEKANAEKRTLLTGKWKDSEQEATATYAPDGTVHSEGRAHKTMPIEGNGCHAIMTFDFNATCHGRWTVSGDTLTSTDVVFDQYHLNDLQIFSPEFEAKYGKQALYKLQQEEVSAMSEVSTMQKEINGKRVIYTIKSIDKSKLVTQDEESKIETAYRVE